MQIPRRVSNEAVAVILPIGDTQCMLLVDSFGGTLTGLQFVDGRSVPQLEGTPAIKRQTRPLTTGVAHELQVAVTQKGQTVAIQASVDGDRLISWKGGITQLSITGYQSLPNSHAIGVFVWGSIVDVQELKLELKRGGRGYRLGEDWKNPLFVVAEQPTLDVAKRCFTWNGQKYFISDIPLSLPQAQLLATQLNGRLLTISSAEEEKFIQEQSRGLRLWTAGWRPPSRALGWRDERNRPLRYIGTWARLGSGVEPDSFGGVQWNIGFWPLGWIDTAPYDTTEHACIEWGEEYPEDLEAKDK